ncbi:DUF1489 family protein [Falsiroseomonas oryziterrae]|uniref:DUF1489 family protein n=1 Tax=Falsiroseomonas oryziterrae TaxID=2911368 RepID=UPI001F43898D|nr:DUF1489 domain-containing protein [Roseomonas sp. NPKOSM-4]
MLHIIKLCVGVKEVAELEAWQAQRARLDPPLRHQTRMMPKRVPEILDGGSLYWVIGGFVRVRQRILDVREEQWDDGSACCGLVLHKDLVPVELRPQKPFQGWRYLDPAAAPPDLARGQVPAVGIEKLPPALRRQLAELCLI